MKELKKLLLCVLSCVIGSTKGLDCFLTCGDFDHCDSSRCAGKCGGDETLSRMSFILDSCEFDDDLCLYREFIISSEGREISSAMPGGCLFKYEHSETDNFSVALSKGTNLFACDSSFCNPPPLESCTQDTVQNGRTDDCFLDDGDSVDALFTPFSPIRDGDFLQVTDRRNFCVLDESLQQFRSDSECFGNHDGEMPRESKCTALDQLQEIDFVSCEECSETPTCDPTQANAAPETLQPTRPPTLSPVEETDSPTESPEQEETGAPVLSEENPTQSPIPAVTDSPSDVSEDENILDNLAVLSGVVFAASLCVFCATIALVLFFSKRRSKEKSTEKEKEVEPKDFFYIGGEKVKVVDPALVTGQSNTQSNTQSNGEEESGEMETPGIKFTAVDDFDIQKERDSNSTNTVILPNELDAYEP